MARDGAKIGHGEGDPFPLERLYGRIGNPMNWTMVERSRIICFNALWFFASMYVFAWGKESLGAYAPYFDNQALGLFRTCSGGLALCWSLIWGWGSYLRRHRPMSTSLVHVTLQMVALSFGLLVYLVGPFTSPVLLVYFIFAPCFVMFRWRWVLWGVLSATAIVVATSTLAQLDIIPYAPLFQRAPMQGQHVGWVWVFVAGGTAAVFLTSMLVTITYTIYQWRDREKRFRELSIQDPLTRVANRRHLMNTIVPQFERARRNEEPAACVMVDIDHFKRINDNYGHQTGDAVLREVAQILRKEARASDLVARYGGEEFAIYLPTTDASGALSMAQRFCERIASHQVEAYGHQVRVTASLGVAVFPDVPASNVEELLGYADVALYRAKRGGRNQVVVSDGALASGSSSGDIAPVLAEQAG